MWAADLIQTSWVYYIISGVHNTYSNYVNAYIHIYVGMWSVGTYFIVAVTNMNNTEGSNIERNNSSLIGTD